MLFRKSYWVNVSAEIDVVPLIHDVKLAIRESEVEEGLMTVYVPDGRGAIVIAPEGLEEDRALRRWLRGWSEAKTKPKEEPPQKLFLSHLFGATQTVPIEKGEMRIDLRTGIFMVDFTAEEARREFCVAIFSESPPQQQPGRGR